MSQAGSQVVGLTQQELSVPVGVVHIVQKVWSIGLKGEGVLWTLSILGKSVVGS